MDARQSLACGAKQKKSSATPQCARRIHYRGKSRSDPSADEAMIVAALDVPPFLRFEYQERFAYVLLLKSDRSTPRRPCLASTPSYNVPTMRCAVASQPRHSRTDLGREFPAERKIAGMETCDAKGRKPYGKSISTHVRPQTDIQEYPTAVGDRLHCTRRPD